MALKTVLYETSKHPETTEMIVMETFTCFWSPMEKKFRMMKEKPAVAPALHTFRISEVEKKIPKTSLRGSRFWCCSRI